MATDVSDVRATFPSYLPHLWTRLTGKPLPAQVPLYRGTWYTQFFFHSALLLASMAAVVWLVANPGPFLVLIFPIWLLTVGEARVCAVTFHHQIVHGCFTGSKRLDRVIGECISLFTLTQCTREYGHDHVTEHHGNDLATLDDPDLQFLMSLGFCPGTPKAKLWRHFYWTLISPNFHFRFLKSRLRSNFFATYPDGPGKNPTFKADKPRRVLTVIVTLTTLVAIGYFHAWAAFFAAYVFPICILYNCSSITQFICEHRWLRVQGPEEDRKVHLARLTSGRFCGEPAPQNQTAGVATMYAWTRWYSRMIFIHLPSRIAVAVGDLPAHDWHHRKGYSKDWPDAIYARQWHIDAGSPGWPEPPTEVWGLHNAIDQLLDFWAGLPAQKAANSSAQQMPPEVFVPLPTTGGIIDKLFAEGMKNHV